MSSVYKNRFYFLKNFLYSVPLSVQFAASHIEMQPAALRILYSLCKTFHITVISRWFRSPDGKSPPFPTFCLFFFVVERSGLIHFV